MENFRVELEFSRIYCSQALRKFIFRAKFLIVSLINFSWPLNISLTADFLSVTHPKADMITAVGAVIIKGHDKFYQWEGLRCMEKFYDKLISP